MKNISAHAESSVFQKFVAMIISSSGQRFTGSYQLKAKSETLKAVIKKLESEDYQEELERLHQLMEKADQKVAGFHKQATVVFPYAGRLIGLTNEDALNLRKYIEEFDDDDQLLQISKKATRQNPQYVQEHDQDYELIQDFFSDHALDPAKFKGLDITA